MIYLSLEFAKQNNDGLIIWISSKLTYELNFKFHCIIGIITYLNALLGSSSCEIDMSRYLHEESNPLKNFAESGRIKFFTVQSFLELLCFLEVIQPTLGNMKTLFVLDGLALLLQGQKVSVKEKLIVLHLIILMCSL